MFDASLSRVGSFRGGDTIRHMAGKLFFLTPGFFRNGEVGLAAQVGLHFVERSSAVPQTQYCSSRLRCVPHHDGRLKGRWTAVEIRSRIFHIGDRARVVQTPET